MKHSFFILFILLSYALASADDLRVVEVRRNIPLSDQDPIYKDFYLTGGVAGLKPNLVVTAVRKQGLKDATGTQALGELQIPVGQLKVIFVNDQIAVAREYKLLSRTDLPMLEQPAIMVGDLIDTKNAFTDKRKPDSVVQRTPPAPSPSEPPGDEKREATVLIQVQEAH